MYLDIPLIIQDRVLEVELLSQRLIKMKNFFEVDQLDFMTLNGMGGRMDGRWAILTQ